MRELKSILASDPTQSRQTVADRLAFRAYLRTGEVPAVIDQFRRATRGTSSKFDPAQPRWPAGSAEGGGRWSPGPQGSGETVDDPAVRWTIAYAFGRLLEELPYPGGRYCVYRFSFGDLFVEGPRVRSCPPLVLSSAVVHGRLLNDNVGD